MYDEIKRCIEDGDWNKAVKELSAILVREKMNEEIAVLAATVHIGKCNFAKARDVISDGLRMNYRNYELWLLLGQSYEPENINQAYLCYENALFYCNDETDAQIIKTYITNIVSAESFCVKRSAIVILSYNSLNYTKVCIESIRRTCPLSAYEIIVVDNASTDGSVEWLKEQNDIKLRCNMENIGYPGGCNQGIQMAENESDIFLLNNDTILADNSLFWLRMGLYENDSVGATGAVSNSVSNLQQVTWNCTNIEEYLNTARINNLPQRQPYQRKNWLNSFAMLIKRPCLEEIGYLDERFTPGQFEDNDFGLRLGEAGYDLLLCRNSFILHFGSGGEKNTEKWTKTFGENKKKIEEKWNFEFGDYVYADFTLLNKIGFLGDKHVKILHIGSGIGATMLALKEKYPKAQVYGIEANKNMVEVTPKNLDVYQGNILKEELSLDKESFDIVICGAAYENAEDQQAFAERAMEYLKEGGRFITHEIDVRKWTKEKKNRPLVSVLMPCYNHAQYVGAAIEAILNQTYPNIELIVADNGCTDNSYEVINQYRDRIKIIRLEKNNPKLCSEMLKEASIGKYVAIATSDDIWMPEKIELQMEAFALNSELQGCFTWALYVDESTNVYSDQSNNVFLVKNRSRKDWINRFFFMGNCLCYPSVVLKREAYDRIYCLRGYVQLGDFYLWILLTQLGDIHIIEKPLVMFRWHESGNNRNESAPTTESITRANQEYADIVLQMMELEDDLLFKEVFGEKFVNVYAESHQELLCERFFLLKHMAERSYNFSDVMLRYYYNHYHEMSEPLEREYEFNFAEFKNYAAHSGLSYACAQLNATKELMDIQRDYSTAYVNIAMELAMANYADVSVEDISKRIYAMLPKSERTSIQNLYRICKSALGIITENVSEDAIYCEYMKLIVKVEQLMIKLRPQIMLLGIMCDDEEVELFEQLVHLGKENKLDLQEAIIPYIREVSKKLSRVIDNAEE